MRGSLLVLPRKRQTVVVDAVRDHSVDFAKEFGNLSLLLMLHVMQVRSPCFINCFEVVESILFGMHDLLASSVVDECCNEFQHNFNGLNIRTLLILFQLVTVDNSMSQFVIGARVWCVPRAG